MNKIWILNRNMLILFSVASTLHVWSIYGARNHWRFALFCELIVSKTSCSGGLSSICLLLYHRVRAWIFKSLIHSNFCSSRSFLLRTHVGSLEILVHGTSSWFQLLISISFSLAYFVRSIFPLPKISLFAWVGSTRWRFIHSCPDGILRNLIFCDILTASVIQLVHFIWSSYRIILRSLQKLRLWRSDGQLVDWIRTPLIYNHSRLINSVLSYGSTVETTTSTVAIFLSSVTLNSFDTQ